jgi:hypothetical protein
VFNIIICKRGIHIVVAETTESTRAVPPDQALRVFKQNKWQRCGTVNYRDL